MSAPEIEIPDSVFQCCNRRQIVNGDYYKVSAADWHNPKPRVNRYCENCCTSWQGCPERVRRWHKKEWRAMTDSVMGIDRLYARINGTPPVTEQRAMERELKQLRLILQLSAKYVADFCSEGESGFEKSFDELRAALDELGTQAEAAELAKAGK